MTFVHDDYLKYEIPSDWCAEENEDTLLIYDPDGEGAIVTSFFSLMDADVLLEERICIMAKEFIDNNLIKLKEPLILMNSSCGKVILRGTGRTSDEWFIKIWIIANNISSFSFAKNPKIVFSTYQAAKKTKELDVCDSIIDSMVFSF